MIIGILGKSGSGKSYICKLLQEMSEDILHLDIDKIGHESIRNVDVKRNIINKFGLQVLKENEIDRKKMGEIVFNSEEKMEEFTQITWDFMEKKIDEYINNNKDKIILLDWQLTKKTKFFDLCDIKVLVKGSLENRMERAMSRDNITKEDFLTREKASYHFEEKDFDYVIENDYTNNIKKKVRELYEKNIISR